MSVQTEIDRISTAVQNAHLKVIEKGGTSAAPYLVGNLAEAIGTIPEASEPTLQSKTVTPTESAQTVKPDTGYDGLSQVSVGAISKTYIGSSVPKQAAKTITPTKSSQTAVASGRYTTGAVTVAAIPDIYEDNTTMLAILNNVNGGTAATSMAGAVSNTETIKNEQADLISQIQTALEGKAAGGGAGVETCTIVVNNEIAPYGEMIYDYLFTVVENGNFAAKAYQGGGISDTTLTIENVVCGSGFYIKASGYSGAGVEPSDGVAFAQDTYGTLFIAPTEAGAVGVVTYFDED